MREIKNESAVMGGGESMANTTTHHTLYVLMPKGLYRVLFARQTTLRHARGHPVSMSAVIEELVREHPEIMRALAHQEIQQLATNGEHPEERR